MGGGVISREKFNTNIAAGIEQIPPDWAFDRSDWQFLQVRNEGKDD
jgi:hypothetical protein